MYDDDVRLYSFEAKLLYMSTQYTVWIKFQLELDLVLNEGHEFVMMSWPVTKQVSLKTKSKLCINY